MRFMSGIARGRSFLQVSHFLNFHGNGISKLHMSGPHSSGDGEPILKFRGALISLSSLYSPVYPYAEYLVGTHSEPRLEGCTGKKGLLRCVPHRGPLKPE